MTKLWRVIAHEYTRLTRRKGFWFGLLSVPMLIVLMVGLVFVILAIQSDTTPIGYVDLSGMLANPVPPPPVTPPERPVPIEAFPDEAAAQAALDAGELQAYYVLAADYPKTARVKLVYRKEPKSPAKQQFNAFLVANLLANQPPEVARRAAEGNDLVIRTVDGSRQMSDREWFNILLPLFAGIVFFIAIFSSSGYLMEAVVEEKENRTMEILVTSVSANQLIAGKTLGILGVGMTLMIAWGAFVALGIAIGRNFLEPLRYVSISPTMVSTALVVILPCFVMLAGLMAAVGATVTEAREGQQITGLISIPLWVPYFFFSMIMEHPNAPLIVALSLFPFTSPLTILLRMTFTVIPSWQIALSVALLTLSAIGSIWLAGRAFRLGMLMYGKRLTWRALFARK